MATNFVMEAYASQIRAILQEHKTCTGHCHPSGEPNDLPSFELEYEHVANLITYFTKGYFDGLL